MWRVIHGKVYNLQSFSALSPQCADTLVTSVGKEASQGFDSAKHSDFTLELLEQCLVGTYREAEVRDFYTFSTEDALLRACAYFTYTARFV